MDCSLCRRAQDDEFKEVRCAGIDMVEECPEGRVPKLLPENLPAWQFFGRISPGLFNGWGGCDLGAIETGFRVYGVPPQARPHVMDKMLAIINAMRAAEKEERDAQP